MLSPPRGAYWLTCTNAAYCRRVAEVLTCCCGAHEVEQIRLDRMRGAGSRDLLRVRMHGGNPVDLADGDAVVAHLSRLGHSLDLDPDAACPARPDRRRRDAPARAPRRRRGSPAE